jgi:hypothetical protein
MIPNEFALTLNPPSQFNPVATVKYDLPVGIRMTLRVYDALGRQVTTLVDGVVNAGSHEAYLNSDGLSSGVYFFRMEAGTFIRTNKMLLLKQFSDRDHV